MKTPLVHCVSLFKRMQSKIQGSSKVVTTVVLHVVVVFSFKREFFGEVENASRQTLGLRHSPRLLARRGSSRGSFGKCCSSHAVNSKGAPASAGCSGAGSGRCKRKPQKNPRSLLNTDSLPDFFEMEFTSVLSSYTDYDPVETRGIVDATDTQNVASCAVNRFIDINFDSSFPCSRYSEHNCERNEDIIIDEGNDAMCCEECDEEIQSTGGGADVGGRLVGEGADVGSGNAGGADICGPILIGSVGDFGYETLSSQVRL